MNKTKPTDSAQVEGDQVLQELWRAKDALSAARAHSVDKLFAGLRKREKKSGRRVVNLENKQADARKSV